ncbi:MAG TPA: YceI family protein [Chitinophagaceae bacterium]|nr:YceI family protein [Chitinophagaceae bacterium]
MITATATTTKWGLDKAHSEIQFKAKHMMISSVTGEFKNYDATIETEDEDFTTAKIRFTAETASVSTGSEQRDGHLKTEDFFNPEKFPMLVFESTRVEKKSDDHFILHGDMTIRDITRPVSLEVNFEGKAGDPWGNMKYGFSINGKINRKDFGLNWNVITEAGGILVSEEVKLHASVQIAKKKDEVAKW